MHRPLTSQRRHAEQLPNPPGLVLQLGADVGGAQQVAVVEAVAVRPPPVPPAVVPRLPHVQVRHQVALDRREPVTPCCMSLVSCMYRQSQLFRATIVCCGAAGCPLDKSMPATHRQCRVARLLEARAAPGTAHRCLASSRARRRSEAPTHRLATLSSAMTVATSSAQPSGPAATSARASRGAIGSAAVASPTGRVSLRVTKHYPSNDQRSKVLGARCTSSSTARLVP